MANTVYQNQKRTLEYSKKAINKAAKSIRHGCVDVERIDAINAIQNFREVHLYPLMLMKNHLVRASNKVSKKIIVARRLKRLPTIINKLERPTLDGEAQNSIKLTRMQDIGGCRAIVKNLVELGELRRRLEQSKSVHKIVNTNDYLIPKESGYGGVHLIYSCFHNEEENHDYKKTKIEIQLRTELQHAWATSLEIIDTLEGFELKTSLEGNEKWRKFFSLSGQLVAHEEGSISLNESELNLARLELFSLNLELDVIDKLARYSIALNVVNPKDFSNTKNALQGMFLVTIIDTSKNKKQKFGASVTHYNSKEIDTAFLELRKQEEDKDILVAVLLSSNNVRTLKKAYPNYFGSTTKFATFITKHTEIIEDLVKEEMDRRENESS